MLGYGTIMNNEWMIFNNILLNAKERPNNNNKHQAVSKTLID